VQIAKDSALVAGAAKSGAGGEPVNVHVIRSFLHQGTAVPVGTTLELPSALVRELIAMHKVTRVIASPSVAEHVAVIEPEIPAPETDPPRRRGRPPKERESQ
jgi:hypothetical protein